MIKATHTQIIKKLYLEINEPKIKGKMLAAVKGSLNALMKFKNKKNVCFATYTMLA
jgi:hypothetical protein